jgi:hypothetical protein
LVPHCKLGTMCSAGDKKEEKQEKTKQ